MDERRAPRVTGSSQLFLKESNRKKGTQAMSQTDNYIFELSEKVIRQPVSYKNRFGITIAADVYRPKDFDESKKYPALIVGAPYGGVKEQGPGI